MILAYIHPLMEISQALARVRSSADMAEGVAAYNEKRKPRFNGR